MGGRCAPLHTPTRSAPGRIVLDILINGKMYLQNESIDLYTLKTMHAICRELGYASFIQKYNILIVIHIFKYFFFCLATICT